MNTLKANAVHMKFSMDQKGVSEFSLGTSESEADERYLSFQSRELTLTSILPNSSKFTIKGCFMFFKIPRISHA